MKIITTITKTYDENKLEEIMQEAICIYNAADLIAAGIEHVVRTDLESALENLKNQLLDGHRVMIDQFVYDCGFGLNGIKYGIWELEVHENITTHTE